MYRRGLVQSVYDVPHQTTFTQTAKLHSDPLLGFLLWSQGRELLELPHDTQLTSEEREVSNVVGHLVVAFRQKAFFVHSGIVMWKSCLHPQKRNPPTCLLFCFRSVFIWRRNWPKMFWVTSFFLCWGLKFIMTIFQGDLQSATRKRNKIVLVQWSGIVPGQRDHYMQLIT